MRKPPPYLSKRAETLVPQLPPNLYRVASADFTAKPLLLSYRVTGGNGRSMNIISETGARTKEPTAYIGTTYYVSERDAWKAHAQELRWSIQSGERHVRNLRDRLKKVEAKLHTSSHSKSKGRIRTVSTKRSAPSGN